MATAKGLFEGLEGLVPTVGFPARAKRFDLIVVHRAGVQTEHVTRYLDRYRRSRCELGTGLPVHPGRVGTVPDLVVLPRQAVVETVRRDFPMGVEQGFERDARRTRIRT